MKKKILITGINGFIGRNLARHLSEDFEIIGVSMEKGSDYCQTYVSAILGEDDFTDKLKSQVSEVDIIIHTAASIFGDEESLLKTNCKGCVQISNIVKILGAKKIIYFSSLPIIGKPSIIPVKENHPLNPQTLYHSTKLFGENVFNLLIDEGIEVINLRLSSPIGFDMPNNRIFSVFVEKCLKNEDITLLGKGGRVQNYIDIRDISECVLKSVQYEGSGTFNLASAKSYSNLELAKVCIEETKSQSKITFSDKSDKEEEYKWIIDVSKAKELLGFEPKYDIRQSIQNRKDFYESSHSF